MQLIETRVLIYADYRGMGVICSPWASVYISYRSIGVDISSL